MFSENKIFGGSVRHVISLSGGKDSLAIWLFAREKNIDTTVVFADTGHENPLTYEYISLLEQRLGPVIRVRADFSQRIINKRHYVQTVWPSKLMDKSINMFCSGFEGELFNREGQPWPDADITLVDLATFAREGYEAQLGAQLAIAYISLIISFTRRVTSFYASSS